MNIGTTRPYKACRHAKPVFGCDGCIGKALGWWCPKCRKRNVGAKCTCGQDRDGPWAKCGKCGHTLKKHGTDGCETVKVQVQKNPPPGAKPIRYPKEKERCTCRVGQAPEVAAKLRAAGVG